MAYEIHGSAFAAEEKTVSTTAVGGTVATFAPAAGVAKGVVINPADQDLSVALMEERLPDSPDTLLHARAHREVIRRFGRFPTRNAALGRENAPGEAEYLASGGYGAVVEALRAQAMH